MTFLPLPFCLPLGLQETLGARPRAWTLCLCVCLPAVASPRAKESWVRQETHGWRCHFPAWSREDPLKGRLGLLATDVT